MPKVWITRSTTSSIDDSFIAKLHGGNGDAALKFLHGSGFSELKFEEIVFPLYKESNHVGRVLRARAGQPTLSEQGLGFPGRDQGRIADSQTSELDDGYEIREIRKDDS